METYANSDKYLVCKKRKISIPFFSFKNLTIISIGQVETIQLSMFEKTVKKKGTFSSERQGNKSKTLQLFLSIMHTYIYIILFLKKSGHDLKITIWESCFPQLNEEELLQIQPRHNLLVAGQWLKHFKVS